MKRGMLFGVIFTMTWVLLTGVNRNTLTPTELNNLRQYSTQEALNLVIDAKRHEFSTQEAANLLISEAAVRDTIVSLVTLVMDDGSDSIWTYADTMSQYGMVATVSVSPFEILHGDTINDDSTSPEYMSMHMLQALENRGWDIQGHGYTADSIATNFQTGDWTATPTANMVRGQVNSLDWYESDAAACFAAFDTMGLRSPRGWSAPLLSTFVGYARMIERAGFDYACVYENGFSGNARSRNATIPGIGRYNTKYNRLSAYPYLVPSRWEIPQPYATSNTEVGFRTQVINCAAVKGSWLVFGGHGQKDFNIDWSVSRAFAFLDSMQDAGRIRIVTLKEGFELMYETPASETANFMFSNFDDVDGDGKPEFLCTSNGTAFRDNANVGFGAHTWASGGGRGTLDSTWSGDTTRTNHGVMGDGYLKLAWGGEGDTLDLAGFDGGDGNWKSYQAWELGFRHMAFARGATMRVEFWAQVDPSIQTDIRSTPLGTGDTIGVWIGCYGELTPHAYGSSDAPFQPVAVARDQSSGTTGHSSGRPLYVSSYAHQLARTPGNYMTFTARDTTGGEWAHFCGDFHIPSWAIYIDWAIWKDSSFLDNAVRISHLTARRIEDNPFGKW